MQSTETPAGNVHKKALPVWRYTGSGWLLGFSTFGTEPGFIVWDEATGMLNITSMDGMSLASTHARDVKSSFLGSDGEYTLRFSQGVYRFKIRGKSASKGFGAKVTDIADTFLFEEIGASYLDEKGLADELNRFLISHSAAGERAFHYRRKLSLKATVLIALAAVAMFVIIGFFSKH
ncbi:hypothetical protein KI440_03880 [Candidatus Saccharibacteria bacterium TM7i]|nr:hypothetical protein KI440_03880 [Candidatus Saccharibacteria bacterium TM7i]